VQWSTRRFFLLLGLITFFGLAIRLGYTIGVRWDQNLWGDAFTYHFTANGIADGKWFYQWLPKSSAHGVLDPGGSSLTAVPLRPSAENPPLYPLYLAAWSVLGLRTYHWHMIASVMLGTSAVFVIGLVGRKIVGPRTGLIAALIAAVYANLWVNDSVGTSEPMGILAAAILLLLAYRAWEHPTTRRVLEMAAMCGVAALVRSEVLLIAPLLVIPLLFRRLGDRPVKERLTLLVTSGAVVVLVMSPWLIRNLTAFEKPVLLSSDAGVSLAATNCDSTYSGDYLGWWDRRCINDIQPVMRNGKCVLHRSVAVTKANACDLSEEDVLWRHRATDYISAHLDRYPVVLLARLGRMWEVYRPGTPWGSLEPGEKINFDIVEGRSEVAARLALAQFYLLVPLAIAGGVILWRRRKPIAPLVAFPVLVSITAMYAFGNTRYRSIAEPALVLLGAVAVDRLLIRYWDRRRGATVDETPGPTRDDQLQPV
jgi:riboflavin transporter FmnP